MYVYEGLATVTVLARYFERPPVEWSIWEFPVRVVNAGPGRTRVELKRYLYGPKDANTLRVVLPDGAIIEGPIIDGCNEPTGGWLLIDVEQDDLPLEQPGTLKEWYWT